MLDELERELADAVDYDRRSPPRIVLLVAPCRSGTTALARVAGYAGSLVVYQKIKEALRTRLLGDGALDPAMVASFRVDSSISESLRLPRPASAGQIVFLKETFGSLHPLESTYSPLRVLLRAGYPRERLHVVAMVRDPLATFAGWLRVWGHHAAPMVLGDHLIGALENTGAVALEAAAAGIGVTRFDFDTLAVARPLGVLHQLFQTVGLPTARLANAVTGWSAEPDLLASDPRFVMPRGAHQLCYLARVHAALLDSPGFAVRRADPDRVEAVIADRLPMAQRHRLLELHRSFVSVQPKLAASR